MSYYILYPNVILGRKQAKKIRLVTRKPARPQKGYGFAEGPLATLKDVKRRLDTMGVPSSRRPENLKGQRSR